MPFTRLLLNEVGPFRKLRLDLTDGQGKPHLGPHILAGVNGSGKTTVLKSLALSAFSVSLQSAPESLFDFLAHVVATPAGSIFAAVQTESGDENVSVVTKGDAEDLLWLEQEDREFVGLRQDDHPGPLRPWTLLPQLHNARRWISTQTAFSTSSGVPFRELVVAYRPSLALRKLTKEEAMTPANHALGYSALSFGNTIDNYAAHRWALDQYSMRAIAQMEGEETSKYDNIINSVNNVLSEIFSQAVGLRAKSAPGKDLELQFCFGDRNLNFSQLPDGVRYLLGLTVDFLRRRELADWDESVADKKPSVLLIDELDGHLHPKWQRAVLPALQKALPDVQIIVSTHSPFVISSCRGAKVHVLQLDEAGNASVRTPMDAPIGESLMATVQDVFGVESRFDVETERELGRWNDLQKRKSAARLTPDEQSELARLTAELAERSEELRMIVKPAAALSESALKVLLKDEVA